MKKICYLINQYPKVSHTFIRREILALERQGAEVGRVSIRRVPESIVDGCDIAELDQTRFIISESSIKSLIGLFGLLLKHFLPAIRALPVMFSLARRAHFSLVKHFFYWLEAAWLYEYCQQQGIGHVHAHFGTNPAAVALLCRAMGGPDYSFTVHGPEEFDSPVALSLNEKIAKAKFVVAITSFCRSQLMRWASFSDWQKIIEVHCALDDALLSSPSGSYERNKHTLVNIGRLCEQKGQWILLQAFVQLSDTLPSLTLHLVGDGEYRATFEEFVRQHGLQQRIIFHGWLAGEQIVNLLDNASAMVLPSFAEGLPVVIMEAFARRTPVVTTNIAGVPELVTPNNGWLVPAGDIDCLVVAIAQCLGASQSELNQKVELAYQAVAERHNADSEAKKLMRAIND